MAIFHSWPECLYYVVVCSMMTLAHRPIPENTGNVQGPTVRIHEPLYSPNRVHVSEASMTMFIKYRRMTCRAVSDSAFVSEYLEWEEIAFNRALRDALIKNEKSLNTVMGRDIIKVVPETMLKTHFTSQCPLAGIDQGDSDALIKEKVEETSEKSTFEDVLINK
ncbi:hypothetical protein L596_022227 [Steinernema carpocapsae]|uniref:Uncharacterized protein n=2 Tax=Steinernema carpocapsae TaxID=34508 RepID=A0A4U5ML75_STECR|nr:hypothetical protein L596_022227 [Steinernema carpocapsae]